jgi:hypothetical protein
VTDPKHLALLATIATIATIAAVAVVDGVAIAARGIARLLR